MPEIKPVLFILCAACVSPARLSGLGGLLLPWPGPSLERWGQLRPLSLGLPSLVGSAAGESRPQGESLLGTSA